jgi:hypothetical protein
MARVKLGQTKLRIRRWINIDLTDVDTLVIKYVKPSGKTGHWDATKEQVGAKFCGYFDVIKIEPPDPPIINELGDWMTWLDATWTDDRHAEGDTVVMTVYKPGTK